MDPLLTPDRITLMSFLCGIIVAGYKRMWVWGYQLREAVQERDLARKERDEWKKMALSTTVFAERAVAVAEKTVA